MPAMRKVRDEAPCEESLQCVLFEELAERKEKQTKKGMKSPTFKRGMIFTSRFYKCSLLVFLDHCSPRSNGEPSGDAWFFDITNGLLTRDAKEDQTYIDRYIEPKMMKVIDSLLDVYRPRND